MQDPCNPTPHHPATVIHHHAPGHIIGRIRRHGTHRIARRLHSIANGCAAGPPLTIGLTTLKTVAPAAAFAALTTVASSITTPGASPSSDQSGPILDQSGPISGQSGSIGMPGIGVGGSNPGTVGIAPHKQGNPHQPPVNVPEPPSLTLLLLVTLGWMGLRFGLRRRLPA